MNSQNQKREYKTVEEYEREGKEFTIRELKKHDKVLEMKKSKLHTYYATMYGYIAEENLIYGLFSSLTMLGILLAALFTIPWVSTSTTAEAVDEFYRSQAPYSLKYALWNTLSPWFFLLSAFSITVVFLAIRVIEVSAQKTGNSSIYPLKAVFSYILPIFVTITAGFFVFAFVTYAVHGFEAKETEEALFSMARFLFELETVKDLFSGAYAVPTIIFSAIGVENEALTAVVSFVFLVYLFSCLVKGLSRVFSGKKHDIISALLASAIVVVTAALEGSGFIDLTSLRSFLVYPFLIVVMELGYNAYNFWVNFKSYQIYNSRDLDPEDQDDETIDTSVPYDGEEFYEEEEDILS